MTNTQQRTEMTEEERVIEREFPYRYPGFCEGTHKSTIEMIIHSCALGSRNSSKVNSRFNSYGQRTKAIVKAVGTAVAAGVASYLTYEGGVYSLPLTLPLVAGAAFILKRNLTGNHPISAAGCNYISPPYFSIFDHLKIGNAWAKISRLQREGKISEGSRERLTTEDCYLEVGRNFGGFG